MTISYYLMLKLNMSDIAVVTTRVVERKWLHRLWIEDTYKYQLDSFLVVSRDLRSFHRRPAFVSGGLQQVAPNPNFLGRFAWLLLSKFPPIRTRAKMRAAKRGISYLHISGSGREIECSEENRGHRYRV